MPPLLGPWIAALLVACGGGDDPRPSPGPEIRDSAGIAVVDAPVPADASAPALELDPDPLLGVGTLDGPPATVWAGVVDPLLLPDGTLVAGDRATRKIRAFGTDGRLRWSAGGEGEGPGEFQRLSWLGALPGDSILTWDIRTRRATVLGPAGEVARSYRAEAPPGAAMAAPVSVVDGPRLLVSGGSSFAGGGGPAQEVVRPEVPYYLADVEGEILDSLGSVPGETVQVIRPGDGSIGVAPLPLSGEGYAHGAAGRVALARPDRVEVRIHGPDGRLEMLLRPRLSLSEARSGDRGRYLEHRLDGVEDSADRSAIRDRLEEAPWPTTYPWLSGLRVSDRGELWIRRWEAPWEAGPGVRWWVFEPSGAVRGSVTTPADFEVVRILGDRIVGVARDALGVEQVRVYRLGS
jgi:hypothetical protein